MRIPSPTSRRGFLASAGLLGASLAAPRSALARTDRRRDDLGALAALLPALARATPGLPAAPRDERDERGWARVRAHFLLPAGDAFFNAGTLGATPRVVLERQLAHLLHVERDLAEWDYDPAHEQFYAGYYPERALREKAARVLGTTAGELSLTANATAGANLVAHGLGLRAGDEVVVAADAHVGSRSAWELRDRRDGLYVRVVRPPAAATPDALVAMFERASTDRTRLWAIEHLTSATGLLYPVAALCARARARSILTVVDAAQTAGHLRTDLRALGCDAWFTSPHKWLLAPVGTGLLHVRRDVQPRVWATIASQHWEHEDGGLRLMQHGTASRSTLEGLDAALDFHLALGPALVERRALHLADRLRVGLARIRGVAVAAPAHDAQRTGTVLWSVAGLDGRALQDGLWRAARVRVRAQGAAVRQCCHVFNLAAEVDRTLAARCVAVSPPPWCGGRDRPRRRRVGTTRERSDDTMTSDASGTAANPGAGLLCPNCRVDLVMSERQGVEIDYCPRCRGVWLDRGELDKILERNAAELAAAQPAAGPMAPPTPPMPPSDYRRDHERERDRHRHDEYRPHKHKRRSFLDDLFD